MPSSCWKTSRVRLAVLARLVLEDDLQALVQVAGDLEPFADDGRVELRSSERSSDPGRKNTVVPVPRAGPSFFTPPCGTPCLKRCSQVDAVATHGRHQLARQRVDDRRADTVQAAGRLVVLPFELAAGMQRREDDLERARLRLRMLVDRNAAPVVLNRDRRAVLVQRRRRCSTRGRSSPRRRRCRGPPRRGGAGRPSRRRRCTCRDGGERVRGLRER